MRPYSILMGPTTPKVPETSPPTRYEVVITEQRFIEEATFSRPITTLTFPAADLLATHSLRIFTRRDLASKVLNNSRIPSAPANSGLVRMFEAPSRYTSAVASSSPWRLRSHNSIALHRSLS